MKSHSNKPKKGFALTEVLLSVAVIIIIGIIAYSLYTTSRTRVKNQEVLDGFPFIIKMYTQYIGAGHAAANIETGMIQTLSNDPSKYFSELPAGFSFPTTGASYLNALTSPYGGRVQMAGGSAGRIISVQITVDNSQCYSIASALVSMKYPYVTITPAEAGDSDFAVYSDGTLLGQYAFDSTNVAHLCSIAGPNPLIGVQDIY